MLSQNYFPHRHSFSGPGRLQRVPTPPRLSGFVEVSGIDLPVFGPHYRDAWTIQAGLDLLEEVDPRVAWHLADVATQILVLPGACGPVRDVQACTAGEHYWRVMVLNRSPSSVGVLETALSLGHEALHYSWDEIGRLIVHHDESRIFAWESLFRQMVDLHEMSLNLFCH
jgi:hypothetical protein